MKNKTFNIFFYAVFLLLFFSTGCKKITENKLEGSWVAVDVADITDPNYEEWTFDKGKLSIDQTIHQDTNVNYYIFIGSYKVKGLKKLDISGFTIGTSTVYNQNWEISTLTKNTLRIVHGPNGLIFKEFYKK